ncbi:MAG: SpvB/TcaC N-terminal domain-containing protein, partial [Bacteroidota bacterium]
MMPQDTPSRSFEPLRPPELTLPQGGGAIRSLDESLEIQAATGSARLSIPLPINPARGLSPDLQLMYSSGAGNGPFGQGWALTLAGIRRKTERQLPRYQDATESDSFLLGGGEELIPADLAESIRTENGQQYQVKRYLPRMEAAFSRIEKWTADSSGHIHWRVTTASNLTTIYGFRPDRCIMHPTLPGAVFHWLPEWVLDDKGNAVLYSYKAESFSDAVMDDLSEAHRLAGRSPIANQYLKQVDYCNRSPFVSIHDPTPDFLMSLVFDYGEHDTNAPQPDDSGTWRRRQDSFSTYRPGFEMRTSRLCQRILMFHRFDELGPQPRLVRALALAYDERPHMSTLREAQLWGYLPQAGGGNTAKPFPPLSFQYQEPVWQQYPQEARLADGGQLPHALQNGRTQWQDVHGEGIPGLLYEHESSWWFQKNLGQGRFDFPQKLYEKPTHPEGQLVLKGMESFAKRQAVVEGKGFYPQDLEGNWQNFQAFPQVPNLDPQSPHIRRLDLTGDGQADLLVDEDLLFNWYASEGEKGYARGEKVHKALDELEGPKLIFAESAQQLFLADMSGDGLLDLVRIRTNEIAYWPNLGYGRFGAKVNMGSLQLSEHLHPDKIRLADVDGSGTTDLIFLHHKGANIFLNQSGNRFSAPIEIAGLPQSDAFSQIDVLDFLGNGTSCLVWSSHFPGRTQIRYLDLLGGQKPWLLRSYANNLGKEVHFHYRSSTTYYLEDQANGSPWQSCLPFPVQCLWQVETFDRIRGSRFVQQSSYHHGVYDFVEREFRGFGRVESLDTESFEHFVQSGATNALEADIQQAPILTKTWFHTGAFLNRQSLLHQYEREYFQSASLTNLPIPAPLFPPKLTADEMRECLRAYKGLVLRQEVYGMDESSDADIPYSVSSHAYELKLAQAKGNNRYASVLAVPRETLTEHYERNASDPRRQHEFQLETDDRGNVLRSAMVSYPRLIDDPSLPPEVRNAQGKLWISVAETDYTNDIEDTATYRLKVPFAHRTYELTGVSPTNEVFELDELLSGVNGAAKILPESIPGPAPRLRLLEADRTYFRTEDLSAARPLGQLNRRGIAFEHFQLSYTAGLLANIFGSRTTDAIMNEAGYVHLEGDADWWRPSGRDVYAPDAANRFFQPNAHLNAFGNLTTIAHDAYHLNVIAVEDALSNRTEVEMDYHHLSPCLLTDPNQNRSAVQLDELGMVLRTAVMGKAGAGEGDTLADPSVELQYDLFRYLSQGEAISVEIRKRERHTDPTTIWQRQFVYNDGMGEVWMTKTEAEPGLARRWNPVSEAIEEVDTGSAPRWIGSGLRVLNNKGNAVKQYEPFFSTTSEPEEALELVAAGVTPILYYDPQGRLVRTAHPDGTESRVQFEAWRQIDSDRNDNVLSSSWYADRGSPAPAGAEPSDPDHRAAWLTAQHADTPGVSHADAMGRPMYVIADNGSAGSMDTFSTLNLRGNLLAITDARSNDILRQQFDLNDQSRHVISLDAGESWRLTDVADQALYAWDSTGQRIRTEYDALRRPIRQWLQQGSNPEEMLSRTDYGEAAPNAVNRNLRGRSWRQFDQAGMSEVMQLDFKGNLTVQQRRFSLTYQSRLNWDVADPLNLLDAETFVSESEFDALNRPTRMLSAHSAGMQPNEILPLFNIRNLLTTTSTRLRGTNPPTVFVQEIDYDAKGQRERILYGNGSLTRYEYEPETFRLRRQITTRNSGADILQDLRYTYDPIGNITEIRDLAQQTHYFNNTVVEPQCRYRYDALYRLTQAEGREEIGQNSFSDPFDANRIGLPQPGAGGQMQAYTEQYQYDDVGNLLQINHGSWVRNYTYASTNNRLLNTQIGSQTFAYSYDSHGNMISMPHLNTIEWDHLDRIFHLTRGTTTAWYGYEQSGQRLRKVVEKPGNVREVRYYLGGFELLRQYRNGDLEESWETLHIKDDAMRIALVETHIIDNAVQQERIRYQYHTHQGSASLELDETAAIISYEEYYPFGSTAYQAGRNNVELARKRYRYTGMERDDESGLSYHSQRYYAAWLGRWTSVDPAGVAAGINLYAYASNNPIRNADR